MSLGLELVLICFSSKLTTDVVMVIIYSLHFSTLSICGSLQFTGKTACQAFIKFSGDACLEEPRK